MKLKISELTVAVIIPMYNASSTIVRALTSLENQTVTPNNVLIVDDGSKDDSVDRVKSYIPTSSLNINILVQGNAGPSSARNKGISYSTEELICFLDADDEWHTNKLEEQLNLYIEKSKKHTVGLVETFTTDSCGEIQIKRDTPLLSGNHFKDFLHSNVIKGTASVMIPRSIINEFGGFDESLRYAEDRLLWSQIASKYDIFTVPEYLVTRHFGTDGNITSNPDKYYRYKKEFSSVFLDKFASLLTKKEVKTFKLLNIYEFLTVFYTKKDYLNTIVCFNDMRNISKSSIYILKFYPFLKYLSSFIHIKFNDVRGKS